jgi:hypothetical protein
MTERPSSDEQLERPHEIDGPDGQRRDGRPTGKPAVATDIRAGVPAEHAPTVAPEEKGATPSTEHAPGGDL